MNQIIPSEGAQVLAQVDSLILELATAEVNLTNARTKIGILLTKVSAGQYWSLAGCDSFGQYMQTLEERFNRGRTQLYVYFGIVRDLLPEVGEKQLSEMGLEKAKLVRKAKKQTGVLPNQEILDAATDSTVTTEDFKKILLGDKTPPPETEGAYHELTYFADDELQETIESAINLAYKTDPVDPPTTPTEIRTGSALGKMAMEFLGSHGGDDAEPL